ncbi:MAG: metallopeptidase TldD-related protein [Propionibacteriaceae bacterium]
MSVNETGAELADRAVALSGTAGCVAIVSDNYQANLRWAGSALTTNGQMHKRTMVFVAFADVDGGTAFGVSRGAVTGADDLERLVRSAGAAAQSSGPAEDAQPLVTPDQAPPAADFGADAEQTTIDVFVTFAPALGKAFAQARTAGHELFGFAEHIVETTWLATSTGVRLRHVQPTGRVELNAKTPDFQRSAWVGQSTTDFADVEVADLYADVVTRLGWSENKIDLPAGRYETLLPPSAVADLLIYALWSASARDAEEGRSAFATKDGGTRIGEQLSKLPITISSDPAYPGIEAAEFVIAGSSGGGLQSVFDNGLRLRRTDWVRDGTLTNLVRTRATVHGEAEVSAVVDNLIMDARGTTSLTEMIAATKRGLLLTCLWYIREVDPEILLLTGLTRDGVYLIEDGKIIGAVNNFRFNESPIDLLTRITEASASERTLPREWNDWFTRTVMPAVRVPDFNMSTVSQAS